MSTKVDLYVHMVWGTSARQPTISREVAKVVRHALVEKSRLLRCSLIELGGTADHLHLLAALNPSVTVARLVGELKGVSSHEVNLRKTCDEPFYWQTGYAAFTVSARELPAVAGYVRDQARRHKDHAIDPRFEPDADETSAFAESGALRT
jgi:REP element-mobilizing transposase RayT